MPALNIMAFAGIAINDVSATGALNDSTGTRLQAVDSEQATSPGVALAHDDQLHVGHAAEERARLHPRQVNDRFWHELSLKPSDLLLGKRAPYFSELALQHLKLIWQNLTDAGARGKAVIALPPEYFEHTEEGEERIGLILGIAETLELPLAALIDSAAAAASRLPIDERGAVYVDFQRHRTVICDIAVNDGVVTAKVVSRPSTISWTGAYRLLEPVLANRFLQETAFEVDHDARTQQAFSDGVRKALVDLIDQEETVLSVEGRRRAKQMRIDRKTVMEPILSVYQALESEIQALQPAGEAPRTTIFSPPARRLPNLLGYFQKYSPVTVPLGTAAMLAAELAQKYHLPGSLEDTPLLREFGAKTIRRAPKTEAPADIPKAPDATAAASPAAVSAPAGAADALPDHHEIPGIQPSTHVLLDGVGYPIGAGLAIGKGNSVLPNRIAFEGAGCVVSPPTPGTVEAIVRPYGTAELNGEPMGVVGAAAPGASFTLKPDKGEPVRFTVVHIVHGKA